MKRLKPIAEPGGELRSLRFLSRAFFFLLVNADKTIILNSMKKIYCYVDEAGQDVKSKFFIVVVVITKEPSLLRSHLLEAERITKLGARKWHKSQQIRKMLYLNFILEKKVGMTTIWIGHYKKPLPYFFPILDTLARSIQQKAERDKEPLARCKAIIYIDGIDKKKASELTNALRLTGISLDKIKSSRDESESLIRFADRWAGCMRAGLMGRINEKRIIERAKKSGHIVLFS